MKAVLISVAITMVYAVSLAVEAEEQPCSNTLNIEMPEYCSSIRVMNPLSGVQNFRPLQLPPQAVIRIKPDTLYRSASLNQLTAKDRLWLEGQGVRSVVDFRSLKESSDKPDQVFDTLDFKVALPIGVDPKDNYELKGHEVLEALKGLIEKKDYKTVSWLLRLSGVNLYELRIKRYQDFAKDFSIQTARFMRLLIDPGNLPLVFHCEGGKDRTGFHAAVMLLTLGYSREDAMNDYLTTNLYTFEKLKVQMKGLPRSLNFLYAAHKDELSAALDVIQERYPVFDDYLQQELGLSSQDLEVIRTNLLENRRVANHEI
ncbi:tyrosine-protein phosphatase [Endozoicomonas arenosclerae]|uniref:tyrosine-protein phosphatase n=1 Tax=Endozoicomonas arenosclerae TaxID=1633495 RepID=UPI000781425E|nr:tyrosine-protein phosphatase [Endozoicomonas arenosclerae]